MSTKKIKAIKFEINLKGRGVVNFDDSSKRFLMMKYEGVNKADYMNDNVKIAKKEYSNDGFKVKISSACLRKHIFGESMEYVTPEIAYSKNVLSSVIANPTMLTRGYMFACKDGVSIKRKGPLSISDAIQTNDAKVVMEMCTATGQRNDTSMFGIESVGDITYKSVGSLSVKQLQFVSTDPRYDRMAVPHDWVENESSMYRTALKANIPNINPTVGYFVAKSSINKYARYAESGMLINDDALQSIIKELLINIRAMFIERATSFAEVESFRILLVRNAINDIANGKWLEITSEEDINNLILDLENFYEQVDEAETMKNRAEIDNLDAERKVNKKEAAANKKQAAAEKKAAKAAKLANETV